MTNEQRLYFEEAFGRELLYKDQKFEALFVGLFNDTKPLDGIASFIDWRLNSLVSKYLIKEKISGNYGEIVLIPTNDKISAEKIVMLGLGEKSSFNIAKWTHAKDKIKEIAKDLNLKSYMISKSSFLDFPDEKEATDLINIII